MGNLTKTRIDEVIKTTATVASEADFMLTHMPFKALVDYVKPVDETAKAHYFIENDEYENAAVFDENSLLDDLLSNMDEHKFIMIQGKNGSGKSHLVRWLYYNYQKNVSDNEKCIFIPRAYNTLRETLRTILNAGILAPDRKKVYMDKIQGGSAGLSDIEFKETVFEALKIIIKHNDKAKLPIIDRERLYKYLSDPVVASDVFMVEHGPIDRLCDKMNGKTDPLDEENPFLDSAVSIPIKDIMPKLMSVNHKAENEVVVFARELANSENKRKTITQYLNSLVEIVIQRTSSFQGTDLKEVFEEIRKELKRNNQSLSLFIEDINSFTGIDSAIIEVLIQDHNDTKAYENAPELCRLTSIIGSTDYFFDKFHDSLKDRLTRNVVILETALLKNEDWIVEFAARYINAINLSGKDSQKWLDSGDEKIPIWKCDYRFSDVTINGVTMSVFPFNRAALINLYNLLPENSKSPRCFLKDVIKHVELKWVDYSIKLIKEERNFYNASISSLGTFLTQNDYDANEVNNPSESIPRGILLRIWGNKTFQRDEKGRLGGIDQEVFDLFEINGGNNDNTNPVVVKPVPGPKPVPQPKPPVKDPEEEALQEKLQLIRQWASGDQKDYKLLRDTRELIGKFLLREINWEHEDFSYDLAASVLKELSTFYIEGQTVSGAGIIRIERSSEAARLFQALFMQKVYGKGRGWDFPGGEEQQIFAKAWLLNHKTEVVTAVRENVFGKVDIDYICIKALLGYHLLAGNILADDIDSLIEVIFRSNSHSSRACKSGTDWGNEEDKLLTKLNSVNELTNIRFKTVIGESDVNNSKYTVIDSAKARLYIERIVEEGILNSPKGIKEVPGDNRIAAAVIVLKIIDDTFKEIISKEEVYLGKCLSKLTDILGEDYSEKTIEELLKKIFIYLDFIRNDVNRSYDPRDYQILGETEAPKKLFNLVREIKLAETDKDYIKKVSTLSRIDDVVLKKYLDAFEKFVEFMNDKNTLFSNGIDKSIEAKTVSVVDRISGMVDRALEGGD